MLNEWCSVERLAAFCHSCALWALFFAYRDARGQLNAFYTKRVAICILIHIKIESPDLHARHKRMNYKVKFCAACGTNQQYCRLEFPFVISEEDLAARMRFSDSCCDAASSLTTDPVRPELVCFICSNNYFELVYLVIYLFRSTNTSYFINNYRISQIKVFRQTLDDQKTIKSVVEKS